MSYRCPTCDVPTSTPPPVPWPPVAPLKASEFGIIVSRGPRGLFSVEPSDGGSLTHYQLDIGRAISGGFPVDRNDPGWLYDRPMILDPQLAAALADDAQPELF